ncbi:MAG: TolC family protein, partial [Chlamydiae bacterium]|nr:TolC family protein [Chlamydiota bacterium]
MKRSFLAIVGIGILSGCADKAMNPYSMAPCNPYSSWTPLKGNCLVSSKYCQTMLPESFDSKELNLAELIDIALQNNPATKQTWANARAAAAQYSQSLSAFFPYIATNTSYFRQKATFAETNAPVLPYLYTQVGPDITLSYTLFDFGQNSSSAMAAREALYYADLNHNQEIQIVIQAAMSDYYDYLYQLEALRSNEANLLNAQTSLDAANEKFALGLAALGDVAQARTQYLQNKINLTTQRQNVENAFAQLAYDLGLPANIPFKVQTLPEQTPITPLMESVDQLVEIAQKQRQDFLAEQANVKSKEFLLTNAKRATSPVLASSLDVGHYWFNGGQQDAGMHWSLQLNLTFPIFK